MMSETRTFLPPDLVMERYIARTGVPLELLTGRDQTREVTRLRQEAMWLLRQLTTASLVQVGLMLGGRDAGTVDNGVDRVSLRASKEADYRLALADLRAAIARPQPALRSTRLDLLRAMTAGILSDPSLPHADACAAAFNLLSESAAQFHERT